MLRTVTMMSLAAVLTLFVGADQADAQTCKWTGRSGEDLTYVKLMWFKRGEGDKDPKPIIGFESKSKYKKLTDEQRKQLAKSQSEDPDILRSVVEEIFEGSGDKADAYYFLSSAAFKPDDGSKDKDELTLEEGRKFEVAAKPCARYPDKYKGFRKLPNYKNGKRDGDIWLSPIAIDERNRERNSKPLMLFGVLAGVVVVGVLLGLIGIKIGDKERGLDE